MKHETERGKIPHGVTSYLVSQCLLKDNWTTAVSSSSSSAPSSSRSTRASTGVSQQFRDGVAKSFKKQPKRYEAINTIGKEIEIFICEVYSALYVHNDRCERYGGWRVISFDHGDQRLLSKQQLQSNPIDTDTEGVIENRFSNRTGMSVDDGARKSNNWLDQRQSDKLDIRTSV